MLVTTYRHVYLFYDFLFVGSFMWVIQISINILERGGGRGQTRVYFNICIIYFLLNCTMIMLPPVITSPSIRLWFTSKASYCVQLPAMFMESVTLVILQVGIKRSFTCMSLTHERPAQHICCKK